MLDGRVSPEGEVSLVVMDTSQGQSGSSLEEGERGHRVPHAPASDAHPTMHVGCGMRLLIDPWCCVFCRAGGLRVCSIKGGGVLCRAAGVQCGVCVVICTLAPHHECFPFLFIIAASRALPRFGCAVIEEQEILNAEPDAQEQLADLRERFPWTKPSEHPMPDKLEDIVSTSGMDWDPQQLSLEEGGPDIKLMDSK